MWYIDEARVVDNFLFYLSLKINSMKEIFSPCDNSLMSLISTGKDELDVAKKGAVTWLKEGASECQFTHCFISREQLGDSPLILSFEGISEN